MTDRTFTPRSARKALSRIEPVVCDLSRLYRAMDDLLPAAGRADQPVHAEYYRMLGRLRSALRRIREEGARVKDPRAGLIDFPARLAGRGVLLCWRMGEPELAFWHEEKDGIAGRRRVDEDGPWEEEGGGAQGGAA